MSDVHRHAMVIPVSTEVLRDAEGFGYYTVEAIMRIYGVSRAYVYKLASKKKWRRYRHPDGTTRYWAENVHDTLRPERDGSNVTRSGKVPT